MRRRLVVAASALTMTVALALTLFSSRTLPAHAAVPRLEGTPPFGHVFVLIGENTSYVDVTAQSAPYLVGTLKPQAAWLTQYSALHSGSLANYIGMTSGQFRGCDANDAQPYPKCHQNIDNLFSQLDAKGISWIEWNESMANPCAFFDEGTDWAFNIYTTHHNPAVYYDNIEGNSYSENFDQAPARECLERVLPAGTTGPNDMSAFEARLASGDLPRFNFVIPNGCEQGHDPCGTDNPIGQFDSFCAREIPQIEASPAFGRDSVIIVTYDEWGDTAPRDDQRVVFAVAGPLVKPGVYDTGPYTHYSFLRLLEDGFALPDYLGAAAQATPITGIWK